jgi:hypothetical protein
MKYLKQLSILFTITLFCAISHAQKTPKDSLSVKIEDKAEVKMSIYYYTDLKETIENDLKQLQDILKENQNTLQSNPYSIQYKPSKKLSIKEMEKTETIIYENGVYKPYLYSNRCNIISDSYHMSIAFNDLEYLTSEDLTTKISESIEKLLKDENRYSVLYHYTFQNDSLVSSGKNGIGKRADFISLRSGVGANLVKNNMVVDLSGEIAVGLTKNGIIKNQYYVSYNLLYNFVQNSSADLNGFLNAGYRHNFSNSANDDNWLGIELGYLINQDGDLFDDNTFKVGLNWDVGYSITVSPQLYISSEQTFPGLRIGFGF